MSFDAAAVPPFFEPGGGLENHLPGYEARTAQRDMAHEVGLVLERGGCLVAEAPTGVGKSLAYLLPSLLWARESGLPVLVATYTKALQDQLLNHDSAIARTIAGGGAHVATLKGRHNYLCLRRLYRASTLAPTNQMSLWNRVIEWAERTETGDLSEIEGLDPEALQFVISRASSDPLSCARCTAADGCWWKRARYRASQADILVINHALLTIELLGEPGMLPEHGALIIDEAHHLESAATRQMTMAVGGRRFRSLGERSQAADGITGQIRKVCDTWDKDTAEPVRAALAEWQKSAGIAASLAAAWFSRMNGEAARGADTRLRYRNITEFRRLCPEDPADLREAGGRAIVAGSALLKAFLAPARMSPDPDVVEEVGAELSGLVEEWTETVDGLDVMLNPEEVGGEWVHWKEWSDREVFNLVAAPRDISGPLGRVLRERYDRVVLTSATLAVGDDFSHVLRRIGLPESTPTLSLASPFDFANTVRLFSVERAPDPRDLDYAHYLATALVDLVRATRRKTLALFTSYGMLRDVLDLVKGPLGDIGVDVTGQGKDGTAAVLLRQFRKPGPALLLGTSSFWEGIDLPGEALEVLVVTRLPFPVPSDPLNQARDEALKIEGRDPFMESSIPEAVLRLRQGFGRLIRRQEDRGVVVILDGRFLTARYGKEFQRSLPVPVDRCPDTMTLAERAGAWMNNTETAPAR